MSLRWKLMLILVLLVGLSTTVVGVVSYQTTESRLMTEIDRSLIQATERFLERPNNDRPNRPGRGVVINIPERPLGIEQFVVQVTDLDGVVLAGTKGVLLPAMEINDGPTGEPVAKWANLKSAQGDDFRVRAVRVELGIVELGRDLTEVNNVLNDLKTRSILLGSMVASLAALIGWVLSVGITSRLRKLSVAAEHVAATGELDIDTPLSGRDEAARLGRSFKEMLAALARSKEQQQRLVEDAGHELRTPLTSLRTNLDVLKRHPNIDSEARQQILLDIDRDTAELAALVEEVVTLAVDRHTDELAQPIEMKGLVTAVAARAARRSGRNIVVTGDTSVVVARRHLVDRAISNLLDNAVKFDTSNNDIEVSISGGKIVVSDRGPGIPESELDLIFERFHRAVASRTLPGSGLGLAIVADVARSHGGDVFARNREGGGAEIGFFLPTAEKHVE